MFLYGNDVTAPLAGVSGRPQGQRLPAALYGWNTFGACAGVLTCQFLLLPFHWSQLDILADAGPEPRHCRTLSHHRSWRSAGGFAHAQGRGSEPDQAARKVNQAAAPTSTTLALLLTCAVLSGLLAGALEGDMFKRINLVVSTSPGALGPAISFWAILAIFLSSAFVWRAIRLRMIHIKIAFVAAAVYFYAAWRLMYPTLIGRLESRYIPINEHSA